MAQVTGVDIAALAVSMGVATFSDEYLGLSPGATLLLSLTAGVLTGMVGNELIFMDADGNVIATVEIENGHVNGKTNTVPSMKEFNTMLDEMTPEQRSAWWEAYFREVYGADAVEGVLNPYYRRQGAILYTAQDGVMQEKLDEIIKGITIKGGSYDNLPEILKQYDINELDYLILSRTPEHRLTPQQREMAFKIRMQLTADVTDEFGVVLPGTRISKSITDADFIKYYGQGKTAKLGGCIALQRDTDTLANATEIIHSTGLIFDDSKFVDGLGNPRVFYIVDGELLPKQSNNVVVRISATADGIEINEHVAQQFAAKFPEYQYHGYSITDNGSSNDTYLNEIWTRYSQGQVSELSDLSGINEENIVTEQAMSYNRITNPDTGTGITLNQGNSNAMGIPEFYAGHGRVDIGNGHIYRVEEDKRTLVAIIDEHGDIFLLGE